MQVNKLRNSCDSPKLPTPVRRIPTNRRVVTGFTSWRGEEAIPFESLLERDFIQRQAFNLAVTTVVPQPCEVKFRSNSGRADTYTPDFLVVYRSQDDAIGKEFKPLLVEVKPEVEWRANWRNWLPKWVAARRYAAEQGWRFKVMDESRIRTRALSQIVFLQRYRDFDADPMHSAQIVADLKGLGTATTDYLLAKHFAPSRRAEGIAHLWHLVAIRQIDCDICEPLNNDSTLWVPYDL